MKSILLPLLLAFLTAALPGQSYYVVSVDGQIYHGDKLLAPKDPLSPDTRLKFADQRAKAHVMSARKGYFVLSAQRALPRDQHEFFVAVKDALIPPSEFRETAIRGTIGREVATTISDPVDVLDFFRGTVAYPDTLFFRLDPDAFSDPDTRLELTAHKSADETCSYAFRPAADGLIAVHLPANASPLTRYSMRLLPDYAEDPDLTAESFAFVPLDTTGLRTEIDLMTSYRGDDNPAAFLTTAVLPFVELRYGRISEGWVRRFLGY